MRIEVCGRDGEVKWFRLLRKWRPLRICPTARWTNETELLFLFLTSNHFSSARRASLASAFPCSTAWRYHWIAWAVLCGTPRPCSYRRPNLNLASESSCAAAAEYHLKASA